MTINLYFQTLCQTSASTVDDNLDNDCDGIIDEDICFSGYGVYGNGNIFGSEHDIWVLGHLSAKVSFSAIFSIKAHASYYAPNFEKVKEHIAASFHPSFCPLKI